VEEIRLPGNETVRAKLDRIDRAIAKLKPGEALDLIDTEIADPGNADCKPELAYSRGGILRRAGRTREAADWLEQCAAEPDGTDGLNYLAGEFLLELGEFTRAIRCLSRCLEIEQSSGSRWYQNAAHLLRAYCAAKLGNFDLAREDIAGVDDGDEPMGWIEADPVVCKRSIVLMMDEGV
jgi:tetratricopeptide (TPR) repeat protein